MQTAISGHAGDRIDGRDRRRDWRDGRRPTDDLARKAWLSPMIVERAAPGGVVVSGHELDLPGFDELPLPEGIRVESGTGRHRAVSVNEGASDDRRERDQVVDHRRSDDQQPDGRRPRL